MHLNPNGHFPKMTVTISSTMKQRHLMPKWALISGSRGAVPQQQPEPPRG